MIMMLIIMLFLLRFTKCKQHAHFILSGDNGYALKPWLLTPFINPQNAQQVHFNVVHSRTRSIVERCIGLLKGRWLCLDATGGRLLYQPVKVCKIVRACAVLHNMAVRNAVPFPPERARPDAPPADRDADHQPAAAAAMQLRLQVMQRLHGELKKHREG